MVRVGLVGLVSLAGFAALKILVDHGPALPQQTYTPPPPKTDLELSLERLNRAAKRVDESRDRLRQSGIDPDTGRPNR